MGFKVGKSDLTNNSFLLDGVNEYFNVNSLVANVSSDTVGTISAMIKPINLSFSNYQVFFAFGDTDANTLIELLIDITTGKLVAQCNVGGAVKWSIKTDVTPFTTSDWYLCQVVQDGVSPILYVNGVAPAQTFAAATTDTTVWLNGLAIDNCRIGCLNALSLGNVYYYNGYISQVSYLNTNISATQCLNWYKNGAPKNPINIFGTNCKFLFKPINRTSDTAQFTVQDSVNSINATSVNMEDEDLLLPSTSTLTLQGVLKINPWTNNKSIYLDGVNEFVAMNNVFTALSGSSTGTFSLWFKPVTASPAGNETLVSFGDTNANEYIWTFMGSGANAGKFYATVYTGATQWTIVTNSAVFTDNVWTHVGVVMDSVLPVLYIDGIAPPQTTQVGVDTTVWFSQLPNIDNGRLGDLRYNNAEQLHCNGNFDEVLFVNRALTANEMLNIYNNGTPKNEGAIRNGVSYFRMGDARTDNWNVDNANAWTFIDQIGNNNIFTVNCEFEDLQTDAP